MSADGGNTDMVAASANDPKRTYSLAGYSKDHSGLIPANLITLAHFSVSPATKLPKSAGEPASTVAPPSARRVFSLGSERPALISRLSLSMISAGVIRGAPT